MPQTHLATEHESAKPRPLRSSKEIDVESQSILLLCVLAVRINDVAIG
jgi:hypothetical protein